MFLCLERLEVPDRLVDHPPPEPQPHASWMSADWLVLAFSVAMVCVGCNSFSPLTARKHVHSKSVAVSPAARATGSWSSYTRTGREALLNREYQTAEGLFLSALKASGSFRSRDVRVDVSLGNLVRLASVYKRIGRPSDASRVISAVESLASQRQIPARVVSGYRTRFRILSETALGSRFAPITRPIDSGSKPYDRLIRDAANSFDVDPALVKAVVAAESNFEPRAISKVGAQGLMQLMPATARAMGVRRPFAPRENLRGGVRYLRSLLDRFEDLDLALAAYNAGPEAVIRHGGIPPYAETEAYVTRVLDHYRRYQTTSNR